MRVQRSAPPPSRPSGAGAAPVYACVDGLRALAAMLVLAYHATLATGLAAAPLLAELKAGVTVFFVISGFLLYLPYARAIRAGVALPAWRRYAERRAVRILPAYWVALLILGLGPLSASLTGARSWVYYGLVQTYNPDTMLGGLGVAWSLCVEVSFYLALPLLAVGVRRLCRRRAGRAATRAQLAVVAGLGVGSLLLRTLTTGSLSGPGDGEHLVLLTSLPALFDWFAVGMGAAILTCEWEAGSGFARRLRGLQSRGWACWLLAGGLYVLAAGFQHGDQFLPLYGLATHALLGLACGLLILPVVVRDGAAVPARLLSRAPARWVGMISYGFYLWHVSLLQALQQALGIPPHAGAAQALMLAVVALAGGILAGALSWYAVEWPVQRLLQRRREGGLPASAVAFVLLSAFRCVRDVLRGCGAAMRQTEHPLHNWGGRGASGRKMASQLDETTISRLPSRRGAVGAGGRASRHRERQAAGG